MNAKITITGLSEAEEAAREILKHIEAIKQLQRVSAWDALEVRVDLKENAANPR